jgi:hypothetical protein
MDSPDPGEVDSKNKNASTVTLWPSMGNQQMPDARTYPESRPQLPPKAFISPRIAYSNRTGSDMSRNTTKTQDFELGNITRPLPPGPIQASFWEKRGLEDPAQNPARRESSNIKSSESKQTGKLGIFRSASKNIARHCSQALNELGDMMYPPTEKAKPRQPLGLHATRAVSTPEQYKQNLPREISSFTNSGYDRQQKLDSPPMRLRPPSESWSEHEIRIDEAVPQNTAVLYHPPKNGRLPIRQVKAQKFGQTQQ